MQARKSNYKREKEKKMLCITLQSAHFFFHRHLLKLLFMDDMDTVPLKMKDLSTQSDSQLAPDFCLRWDCDLSRLGLNAIYLTS